MAEKSSFIKIDRNIINWRWYKKHATKDVFLHLLYIANYKEGNFENVKIKRGQVVSSYPKLAEQTGYTIQQVRTAIRNLKSTGEITVETTSKFSIFTIQNYNKYQTANRQNNKLSNSQSTVKQQASNSQSTTIKESKEVKNSSSTTTTPKIPTFTEVENHYKEKAYTFDCCRFYEYYSDRKWKMKDSWQQVMAEWQRTEREKEQETTQSNGGYGNIKNQMTDEELREIRRLKAEGLL